MKIALDPYMFRRVPLTDLLGLVADLGYQYIELWPRADFMPFFLHPRADKAQIAEFSRALTAAGVQVSSVLPAPLDLIEVLADDLGALAGALASLIVDRIWVPVSATSRAGELTDLLRRGRPLLLQGVASTLADRLGAALAERAGSTGDGRLQAALEEVRVGAITDSAGTIHRRGHGR